MYSLSMILFEAKTLLTLVLYSLICSYVGIVDSIFKYAMVEILKYCCVLEADIEDITISFVKGVAILKNVVIFSPDDAKWTIDRMVEIPIVQYGLTIWVEAWEDPASGEQFLNVDLIGVVQATNVSMEKQHDYDNGRHTVYDSGSNHGVGNDSAEVHKHLPTETQMHTVSSNTGLDNTNFTLSAVSASIPSLSPLSSFVIAPQQAQSSINKATTIGLHLTNALITSAHSANNPVAPAPVSSSSSLAVLSENTSSLFSGLTSYFGDISTPRDFGVTLTEWTEILTQHVTSAATKCIEAAQQGALLSTAKRKIRQAYTSATRSLGLTLRSKLEQVHEMISGPEPAVDPLDLRIYGWYLEVCNARMYLRNAMPAALRHLEVKKNLFVPYFKIPLHSPSDRQLKPVSVPRNSGSDEASSPTSSRSNFSEYAGSNSRLNNRHFAHSLRYTKKRPQTLTTFSPSSYNATSTTAETYSNHIVNSTSLSSQPNRNTSRNQRNFSNPSLFHLHDSSPVGTGDDHFSLPSQLSSPVDVDADPNNTWMDIGLSCTPSESKSHLMTASSATRVVPAVASNSCRTGASVSSPDSRADRLSSGFGEDTWINVSSVDARDLVSIENERRSQYQRLNLMLTQNTFQPTPEVIMLSHLQSSPSGKGAKDEFELTLDASRGVPSVTLGYRFQRALIVELLQSNAGRLMFDSLSEWIGIPELSRLGASPEKNASNGENDEDDYFDDNPIFFDPRALTRRDSSSNI